MEYIELQPTDPNHLLTSWDIQVFASIDPIKVNRETKTLRPLDPPWVRGNIWNPGIFATYKSSKKWCK